MSLSPAWLHIGQHSTNGSEAAQASDGSCRRSESTCVKFCRSVPIHRVAERANIVRPYSSRSPQMSAKITKTSPNIVPAIRAEHRIQLFALFRVSYHVTLGSYSGRN